MSISRMGVLREFNHATHYRATISRSMTEIKQGAYGRGPNGRRVLSSAGAAFF